MPIFQCQNPNRRCPKTFNVSDELVGRRANCPECGFRNKVPSPHFGPDQVQFAADDEQEEINIAATPTTSTSTLSVLRTRAESGDTNAMRELAMAYLKGTGVAQDFDKAEEWLQRAAELGNAEAQSEWAGYIRAICEGEEDSNKKFYWYQKAFEWEQKAAEQGLPISQYNLGVCYRDGIGTQVNPEMQFYWFGKAARNGFTDAKLSFAICYLLGVGTVQDFEQAIYWLRQAADEGNAEAKMRLGVAYIQGYGCSVDTAKGVSLLREAAELGNEKAQELLNSDEVRGIIDGRERANAMVSKPQVSGKLIVMIVGGIIGAIFCGAIGSEAGTGGVFGGLLAGAYFGIGIGTFLGYVKTELVDIWSFAKFSYDIDKDKEVYSTEVRQGWDGNTYVHVKDASKSQAIKDALIFTLISILIWRVPKLIVLFFISPLIAIYRLLEKY